MVTSQSWVECQCASLCMENIDQNLEYVGEDTPWRGGYPLYMPVNRVSPCQEGISHANVGLPCPCIC